MKTTKVINLFAGPSAGKSTNTHSLMGWMKEQRMNVECALEVAKDIVWRYPGYEHEALDDQISIFASQNARIYPLIGQVDYVITDSPLLLSLVYLPTSHKKFDHYRDYWENNFSHLVLSTYNQYDNVNYFIERGDREYLQKGRVHTEEEAVQKDEEILRMLNDCGINFKRVKCWQQIVNDIFPSFIVK